MPNGYGDWVPADGYDHNLDGQILEWGFSGVALDALTKLLVAEVLRQVDGDPSPLRELCPPMSDYQWRGICARLHFEAGMAHKVAIRTGRRAEIERYYYERGVDWPEEVFDGAD